jgi:GGDEF domain-containing protein
MLRGNLAVTNLDGMPDNSTAAEQPACGANFSESDTALDAVTFLLRKSCATNIAMLSLVDECHEWFKATCSLSASGVAHDLQYCVDAPVLDHLLEASDAASDMAMRDNPLVVGAPFVRSYLGHPIKSQGGALMGVVGIATTDMRDFRPAERGAVGQAAMLVAELISLRKTLKALDPQPVVLDRQRLEAMLQAELASGRGHPIVGLAEIANYSEVVRDYGQQTAEKLLDAVMQCASEMAPPHGRLSRLGDTFFGFTLPDMSPSAAAKLVRSLQEIVTDMVVEVGPDVSASSTICCVLSQPEMGEPISACWDRMIMGLDQAKETGPAALVDMIVDDCPLKRAAS